LFRAVEKIFRRKVFTNLRSSTKHATAASPRHPVPALIRHAGEGGIQGRKGMDTGFRRYDRSLCR
jgi:hypothetical protein